MDFIILTDRATGGFIAVRPERITVLIDSADARETIVRTLDGDQLVVEETARNILGIASAEAHRIVEPWRSDMVRLANYVGALFDSVTGARIDVQAIGDIEEAHAAAQRWRTNAGGAAEAAPPPPKAPDLSGLQADEPARDGIA